MRLASASLGPRRRVGAWRPCRPSPARDHRSFRLPTPRTPSPDIIPSQDGWSSAIGGTTTRSVITADVAITSTQSPPVVTRFIPRPLAAVAMLGFISSASAQTADRAEALRTIIAAERAFAAMAGTHGIRDAFYNNIAEDGILFRPRAVVGKPVLASRPSTRGPAALLWDPRWVDVAASGDFGFTTGPSEMWPNGQKDTVVSKGSFVTIWTRQGTGPWRFAIDVGVSGPTTLGPQVEPGTPASIGRAPEKPRAELVSALEALDGSVGNDTIAPGKTPRLAAHLLSDGRVYRDGQAIASGPAAAGALITRTPGIQASTRQGSGMARSGDLAYTYGTYELIAPGAERKVLVGGNYLRIWKRGADGRWKVVLDIESPVA
jgi:ketosteroid isomerase-like protein